MKLFLTILSFLLFILNPSKSAQILPTLLGNYLSDAYQFSPHVPIDELSKRWAINGVVSGTDLSTICGALILGGENITPPGTSLSRSYNDLPTHGIIFYYFWIVAIDFQAGQQLHISIDDRNILSFEPVVFSDTEGSLRCGPTAGIKDPLLYIAGSIFHTGSTLKFAVKSDSSSDQTFFGLSDLKIRFAARKVDDVEGSHIFVNNPNGYPRPLVPQCGKGKYYNTDSSSCESCDDSCQECFGSTSQHCYGCANIYTYDATNDQCVSCYDTTECLLCSGSQSGQCSLCRTTNLQIDGTCQSGCAATYDDSYYQICTCPGATYPDASGCAACSPGCTSCTSDTNCLVCDSGTTLLNGACQCPYGRYWDNGSCNGQCPTGQYYIIGSGCAGQCSSNCNACTNSTFCYDCAGGSYPTNNQCNSCSPGCTSCTNDTSCQTCVSQATIVNGACHCDYGRYFVSGSGCAGQCPTGRYYTYSSSSCTGQCPTYCNACTNSTYCYDCPPTMVWLSNQCQCSSPGIFYNGACQDTGSTLNIIYTTPASSLTNLILQAQIAPAEEAVFTPIYSWTFTSITANSTRMSQLQTYLSTQNTKNLLVPASGSYLEAATTYSVTASYNNAQSNLVSKTITITTTSIELQVNIRGGNLQALDYSIMNTLTVEVILPNGTRAPSSSLQVTWTQTSGNTLNLSPMMSLQTPLVLSIPRCTLMLGKSYSFTATARLRGTTTDYTAGVTIISPQPKLNLTIPNGNKGHKATEDLQLQSNLGLQDKCNLATLNDVIDSSSKQYTWECSKTNSQGATSQCTDASSIFSSPSASPSLIVPSSYFSQDIGVELTFKLTVTAILSSNSAQLTATAQTSFTIIGDLSPTVSLAKSTNATFSSIFDLSILENGHTQHTYTYSWEFSPDVVQAAVFEKKLKILTDLNFLTHLGIPSIRGKVTTTDETGASTVLYYQFPINQPPSQGTLAVNPISGGASLDTSFFISTSGWIDEDIPLTYQFFYSQTETGEYKALTSTQLSSFTTTSLVSSTGSTVYVKVVVTDNLGASNSKTIQVNIEPDADIASTASKVQSLMTMKNEVSSLEMINILDRALESLSGLETTTAPGTGGCPLCSGRGQCVNNQCVCETGYTLSDCSLTMSDYNSITDTKLSVLNVMVSEVSSASADPQIKETITQNVLALSSSIDFNSYTTLTIMQDILDTGLNMNTSGTVLTPTSATSVSNILDNMLTYASVQDPNLDNSFGQNLETRMNQYLSVVSNSMLTDMLPGEDPVIVNTSNFGSYTVRTTICNISSQAIRIGADYPSVQISPSNIANEQNCSVSLDIIYYAVNGSLFNGTEASGSPVLAIRVSDSLTGRQVNDLSVRVTPTGNQQCPVDCEKIQGDCICVGIFDIAGQFAKIFRKSNVGKLGNFSALANFKFWESLPVWTVIGFTTWFAVSIYIVKWRAPNYNLAEKTKQNTETTTSKMRQFKVLILTTHPILSIYFYKDELLSKTTKLILFYQQVILMLTYTAIFPEASKESVITSKIILMLIKSVTVTPIAVILMLLIKDLNPIDRTKMTWFRRHKRRIGIILAVLVTIACVYMIVVIAAQTDSSTQSEWTINFLIVIGQSIILSPPAGLTFQVSLILYVCSNVASNWPRVKKMASKIINLEVAKLYAQVCSDHEAPRRQNAIYRPQSSPESVPIQYTEPENVRDPTLQEIPMEFLTPEDSPTNLVRAHNNYKMPLDEIVLRFESDKEIPDTTPASKSKFNLESKLRSEFETGSKPLSSMGGTPMSTKWLVRNVNGNGKSDSENSSSLNLKNE